jgi:hypothetical protein
MRVTDDRYQRERANHELALRMIRHEARTCTIRACTQLTDDRIRKLYRTYVGASSPVRRKRGKSPRQVEFFTRNLAALIESGSFAAVLCSFSLIPAVAGPVRPSLEFGTRFCDAYECYTSLLATTELSFEHAWCLLGLLTLRKELILLRCRDCDGQHIADPVIHQKYACPLCKIRRTPLDQIPSVRDWLPDCDDE